MRFKAAVFLVLWSTQVLAVQNPDQITVFFPAFDGPGKLGLNVSTVLSLQLAQTTRRYPWPDNPKQHNFGEGMAFPWGSHDLPHILDTPPCEEGCSAWDYLGGGDFPYTDCNGTDHWGGDQVWATAVVPTTYGWMEWDVTVLVQEWNAGSFPNHGLIIRDIEEQWHSPCLYPDDNKFGTWFYSKEYVASGEEEGDYRPYLLVTYDLSDSNDSNDPGCDR